MHIFLFALIFLKVAMATSEPSVIIIGAGPAGVAAAAKLLEHKFSDIKILEAESRIGGRIHSVGFGDSVVDLGAQWVHGDGKNVVYHVIKDFDVVEVSNITETFYHSSGKTIDQKLAQDLSDLLNEIYYGNIDDDGTLGDYLIRRYNEEITKRYAKDPEKLQFASEFLDVLRKEVLMSEGAFSWFDTAAETDYDETEGHQWLNWKGRGFRTLLDILVKAFPDPSQKLPFDDKLMLDKEVVKIVWDGQDKASVECADGQVLEADHVIVTVSLGVLKDRYYNLFAPALPQQKIDAITELGIAAVAKVYLKFPATWWPEDFNTITPFWTEADKKELLEGPNKNKAWVLDLSVFHPIEKNPAVLETWFGGERVPQIEELPDEEVVDGLMFVLEKFAGQTFPNLSRPEAILRSKWYHNPHFRGCYSFQTVASRKRAVSGEVALSQPLKASSGKVTLLFAGEASSHRSFATVHGAVESGFREAERIIKMYD